MAVRKARNRQAPADFAPWKADRGKARRWRLFSGVLMVAAALFAAYGKVVPTICCAVLVPVFWGFSEHLQDRARRREFGKDFEGVFIARAARLMADRGIPCSANVLIEGLGDVDMVAVAGGEKTTIEIKSFRYWEQFAFLLGGRERKAVRQARAQKDALDAKRAVVWLPQGRASVWQRIFGSRYRGVQVVFGDEKALVRAVGGAG